MAFCEVCGSRMRETSEGFLCPKCGKLVRSKPKLRDRKAKTMSSDAVYVIDKSNEEYVKISRRCPNCGNGEALHWTSNVSGEHAGVARERTVNHFRCVKCSHSWTEST